MWGNSWKCICVVGLAIFSRIFFGRSHICFGFASGENSPKKAIAHDVVNYYGDIVKNCCKMALSKYT
jgi:hypothetical protein